MKKFMIMAVAAVASGLAAWADTSFAYQGVLRDEMGNRLSASQATITFRLYDAATEGNKLWEREMTLAIDTNGLFNAELTGDNLDSTLADAENQGKTVYVALEVSGSAGEITPRQKMVPTPLASYAQNVAKADKDFTVNGTAYFKGSVSMQTTGTVFHAKSVSASESLDVAGATTLRGNAELQGDVKVANSLTVGGVYMSLPVGSIIMWAGEAADLPDDGCWAICDGQTTYTFKGKERKVPDLRGRFIVGAGTATSGTNYVVGATGGEETHKLTIDELAKHYHEPYDKKWTAESFKDPNTDGAVMTSPTWNNQSQASSNPGSHKGHMKTDYTGGDQPHENRPPYYALCYIIKIK